MGTAIKHPVPDLV